MRSNNFTSISGRPCDIAIEWRKATHSIESCTFVDFNYSPVYCTCLWVLVQVHHKLHLLLLGLLYLWLPWTLCLQVLVTVCICMRVSVCMSVYNCMCVQGFIQVLWGGKCQAYNRHTCTIVSPPPPPTLYETLVCVVYGRICSNVSTKSPYTGLIPMPACYSCLGPRPNPSTYRLLITWSNTHAGWKGLKMKLSC